VKVSLKPRASVATAPIYAVGKLILKINALPADKRASFSAEEIFLMRSTINQLRNDQLAKGQYTDAADDMLLKLF
jgi:hypothetical protein